MGKVKVRLKLSGLACMGCVATVKAALERAGAEEVNVTLNEAEFFVDEGEKVERFVQVVRDSGYDAKA